MGFPERLKILIEESDLSAKEFGKLFNLAESTISNYLAGKRVPDDETKLKICERYNVSLDWLLGKSEYRNEEELLEHAYFKKLQTKYGATEGDIKLALDFIKRAKQKTE